MTLDERCAWMRQRQAMRRANHSNGRGRRRLPDVTALPLSAQDTHFAVSVRRLFARPIAPPRPTGRRRTCSCNQCGKCRHRLVVRQRRAEGYLSPYERRRSLYLPLDQCAVWQRLKTDRSAEIQEAYQSELEFVRRQKMRPLRMPHTWHWVNNAGGAPVSKVYIYPRAFRG
jgi:hypothetical protein